jgi:hypothetical protein
MTRRPELSGTPIEKDLWEFRGSILKDGYIKYLLRILTGGNGKRDIPIP